MDVITPATSSHNAQSAALNPSDLKTKKWNGVGINAPSPTLEQHGAEPRSEERMGEDKCETGRTNWDSMCCPAGHPKDSPPQEVLNPNGLNSPHQPQRVVNPNGLDPPYQPHKVVNLNGSDPPEQLKLKEKLELVVTEEDTGVQHQEIASGGEQSITCTGVLKVQAQEAVPAYTVRAEVGNVSVNAIVDTAAEITVILEEVYRRINLKPRLSRKRRVRMAGKGQSSWANLVGTVSVRVGPLSTQETMYVAQINYDMLMGVGYLDKCNAADARWRGSLYGRRFQTKDPRLTSSTSASSRP
ncbi:hypothetical protein PoB_001798000 [Plakobranchus ocellatus]|uniref:Peptidase A2 domain-containing protein n=1 Tax=Plakobranchus ocellatus TaxID=259542 RepID=A0AAV3Z7J8_9GAST|nr:hypothetical protein PoB_001798000 [Plakobranchus ocellatus]